MWLHHHSIPILPYFLSDCPPPSFSIPVSLVSHLHPRTQSAACSAQASPVAASSLARADARRAACRRTRSTPTGANSTPSSVRQRPSLLTIYARSHSRWRRHGRQRPSLLASNTSCHCRRRQRGRSSPRGQTTCRRRRVASGRRRRRPLSHPQHRPRNASLTCHSRQRPSFLAPQQCSREGRPSRKRARVHPLHVGCRHRGPVRV